MYEFEFKGGLRPAKAGTKYQFLLFLLIGGNEVPFWEAKRQSLVTTVMKKTVFEANPDRYQTSCKHLKLFVQEQEFGKSRLMCSFYLELGGGIDRQEVIINPLRVVPKAFGWKFEAAARFMTNREVRGLLDPTTIGYKLLGKMPLPPRDTLKQMITIKKLNELNAKQKTRKLRIR